MSAKIYNPDLAEEFKVRFERWGKLTAFLEQIEEAILGEEPQTRFTLEQVKDAVLDEIAAQYRRCNELALELGPDYVNKMV
jgi:hypothetical protein